MNMIYLYVFMHLFRVLYIFNIDMLSAFLFSFSFLSIFLIFQGQLKKTKNSFLFFHGSPVVKNHLPMQETRVSSLGGEDDLQKEMATQSSILPGKSHGQRSLAGYSPWSPKRVRHDLVIKW